MLAFIVSGFFACQSKDSETISEPVAAVDLRPNVRVESVEEQALFEPYLYQQQYLRNALLS